MQPTPDELVRLLRHHPSAALTVKEARDLLSAARPDSHSPDEDEIASLSERDPQLRLLALPRRRWAGVGPGRWILLDETDGPSSRSIAELLRRSLHRIGQALEPGSTRSLARWERMLREERKVVRVLSRRG